MTTPLPQTLPLNLANIKTIAVLGDDAHDAPIVEGTGSGTVHMDYVRTPLEEITTRAGAGVQVTYANSQNIKTAIQNAQAADLAIVCVAIGASDLID